VPHVSHLRPATTREELRGDGAVMKFYVIGTWTSRKALGDCVTAFLSAFTSADRVALHIHTTSENLIAKYRVGNRFEQLIPEGSTWYALANAMAGYPQPPPVTLSTRTFSRDEIDGLHADSDCFVLLSRGEGFGLGAFDAAAFGNPIVVTGWGASPEFVPEGYPYLVDCDLVPTRPEDADAWWLPKEGECWAKARISHAAHLMREIYEHRTEASTWGAELQSLVTERFASQRVTEQLLAALG